MQINNDKKTKNLDLNCSPQNSNFPRQEIQLIFLKIYHWNIYLM